MMEMMESPVGTTYKLRSYSLLPVGHRMTDKADSCSELSTAVITGKASCICGLGCGDGLTAVAIRTSSKCCTPVRQAFCHLDLLSARSSQVAGSMPVDSRLAFKLSLKPTLKYIFTESSCYSRVTSASSDTLLDFCVTILMTSKLYSRWLHVHRPSSSSVDTINRLLDCLYLCRKQSFYTDMI